MSVTAAGIGYLFMPALLALPDMTSQRRRTARLDGCHHAALAAIEMASIGLAIRFTVAAEDLRHLEGRTPHAPAQPDGLNSDSGRISGTAIFKCSSGLSTAAIVLVATLM